MKSILVVADTRAEVAPLWEVLRSVEAPARHARSVTEALELIGAEPPALLITTQQLADGDGVSLVECARELAPRVQEVMICDPEAAASLSKALALSAIRTLRKPLAKAELASVVDALLCARSGLLSSQEEFSLVDILQIFHATKRSVSVAVRGSCAGVIHVDKGEVIHAVSEGGEGVEALRQLLAARTRSARSSPLLSTPQTIALPFQRLMLTVTGDGAEDPSHANGSAHDGAPHRDDPTSALAADPHGFAALLPDAPRQAPTSRVFKMPTWRATTNTPGKQSPYAVKLEPPLDAAPDAPSSDEFARQTTPTKPRSLAPLIKSAALTASLSGLDLLDADGLSIEDLDWSDPLLDSQAIILLDDASSEHTAATPPSPLTPVVAAAAVSTASDAEAVSQKPTPKPTLTLCLMSRLRSRWPLMTTPPRLRTRRLWTSPPSRPQPLT